MNGAPLRATGQMKTHETMAAAILPGDAERIALLMNVSADYVRRWRREPESGDDNGTGRRDPLQVLLLLIDAIYARNPEGAELIVDRINEEMATLRQIHGRGESLTRDQLESALQRIELQLSKVTTTMARSKR